MDFGIAVKTNDTTQKNQIVGTPGYLSPEAAEGLSPTPAMDVFSAGLILFEMLTGQRAVVADSVTAILQRLAREDVRLPQDSTVDEHLSGILHKAIARDPSVRYQSMAQFGEALDISIRKKRWWRAAGGRRRSNSCCAGCATRAIFRPCPNRSVRSTRSPTARRRASTSFPTPSSRISR
jgi:serine/threonine protein kinase